MDSLEMSVTHVLRGRSSGADLESWRGKKTVINWVKTLYQHEQLLQQRVM